jgi:hypothetical protein
MTQAFCERIVSNGGLFGETYFADMSDSTKPKTSLAMQEVFDIGRIFPCIASGRYPSRSLCFT